MPETSLVCVYEPWRAGSTFDPLHLSQDPARGLAHNKLTVTGLENVGEGKKHLGSGHCHFPAQKPSMAPR